MPEMTAEDLARFKAAVRLRDRCVELAVELMVYRGQRVDRQAARTTYDAIADVIREDERKRVPKAEAKPSTSKDLQLPGEVFERAWEIWLDHFGDGNVEKLRAVGAFIFAAGRAQAAADIRAHRGSLDGLAWQERAARVAEGSDGTGTDRDEVMLPASTGGGIHGETPTGGSAS